MVGARRKQEETGEGREGRAGEGRGDAQNPNDTSLAHFDLSQFLLGSSSRLQTLPAKECSQVISAIDISRPPAFFQVNLLVYKETSKKIN